MSVVTALGLTLKISSLNKQHILLILITFFYSDIFFFSSGVGWRGSILGGGAVGAPMEKGVDRTGATP